MEIGQPTFLHLSYDKEQRIALISGTSDTVSFPIAQSSAPPFGMTEKAEHAPWVLHNLAQSVALATVMVMNTSTMFMSFARILQCLHDPTIRTFSGYRKGSVQFLAPRVKIRKAYLTMCYFTRCVDMCFFFVLNKRGTAFHSLLKAIYRSIIFITGIYWVYVRSFIKKF